MLVNIQGNIIDTTKIIGIQEIVERVYPPYFSIQCWNGNIFRIERRFNTYSKVYNNELKLAIKALEKARQEVIEYWNKDKSIIPEIKID